MRRNCGFRGFATVASIWLAVCLAVPMQLHTCVMHGGLAIDVSAHGNGPQTESLHSGHHGATASHAAFGHSHQDQSPDGQSKQCSCLGDCSTGKTPVALTAAPTQLAVPQGKGTSAVFSYESPSLVSPHFLLPFSNGPPGASSRA